MSLSTVRTARTMRPRKWRRGVRWNLLSMCFVAMSVTSCREPKKEQFVLLGADQGDYSCYVTLKSVSSGVEAWYPSLLVCDEISGSIGQTLMAEFDSISLPDCEGGFDCGKSRQLLGVISLSGIDLIVPKQHDNVKSASPEHSTTDGAVEPEPHVSATRIGGYALEELEEMSLWSAGAILQTAGWSIGRLSEESWDNGDAGPRKYCVQRFVDLESSRQLHVAYDCWIGSCNGIMSVVLDTLVSTDIEVQRGNSVASTWSMVLDSSGAAECRRERETPPASE